MDQPNQSPVYDLIIVGAGVAGMTASIYASRYKLNHLVFGEISGGQGVLAGTVENYPGFTSIAGPELMQKFVQHVASYKTQIRAEKVGGLDELPDGFEVKTEKGKYKTRTLILATGATYRRLNIPGEEEFLGKGVSYCTTCDAPFFKEKQVAITGGGDSAVTGAIHAAAFASKVFLIHRRDEYRAEPVWIEKMKQNTKIEEILSTQIKEIKGVGKIEEIILDKPYKGSQTLKVDGVFIEIGQVPSSVLTKEVGVNLDGQGYIEVTPTMATSVPGVFAAGDIAAIKGGLIFRQFITSASDGARAAASVYRHLHKEGTLSSWGE